MKIYYKKIGEKIKKSIEMAKEQGMEIDFIELNQCEWHMLKNEFKDICLSPDYERVNSIHRFFGVNIVVTKE